MSIVWGCRSLSVASCFLVATAVAVAARGADVEAIFFLYLNEVEAGEIFAVMRDGDVLVERGELEAAGLRGFQATEIAVGERTLISLASLRPRVRFAVDEEEVALRLHAPAELFPAQHLDLGGTPPEISYASRPSAFINYAPRLRLPSEGAASGHLFVETGVSEDNRLFYTSVSGSTTTGFVRGLTNVNFDDRSRLRRLTLGDTSIAAGPIGGSLVMGGVTVARDFGLDPYFARHPKMRFTSSTDVPATVDIFVNGVRVRSETLQPGAFTLDNLRGLAGAGTVRYVVRDAFGRQQSHFRPYYIGPDVLAEGLEDYAVSAGLPRVELGVDSFSYLGPSLVSFYRRGVSDRLTLGARAEARWDRLSTGLVAATATRFGAFEVEVGASAAADGQLGAAGVLSHEYISRRFNVATSLRLLSDEYATVSLDPEDDRSVAQANLSFSVPVSGRATFAAQHSVDVHRDAPPYARVGALAEVRLFGDLSLTAQLALVTLAPPTSSWDGYLGLTWSPRSGFFAGAGASTTNGVAGANFQVNRPAQFGEDWSMMSGLDVSTVTRASVQTHLHTKSSSLSAYFDQTPGFATLAVEPAGSLVWVKEGGLFLSRPIYDGFALVRVPKVKDVRVFVNAQEVGKTNEAGYVLAPSMISHFGSHVTLAPEDVPLDYDLAYDKVVAAPPRRGAAYVDFPAKRVHYFRGRLRLLRGGVEEDPTYGDLIVEDGREEVSSAIGRGGVFELEGLTPGVHQAVIVVKSARCRFSFEVPDADALLVDLGVLTCELD